MNFLIDFIPYNIISAIGAALINSIWQSAIIAIVLAAYIKINGHTSSKTKYFVSYLSLISILAISIITFTENYEFVNQINSSNSKILLQNEQVYFLAEDNIDENIISKGFVFSEEFINRNKPLIVAFWLTGVLVLLFRMLGGIIYTNRIKNSGQNISIKKLNNLTEKISNQLGINKAVRIFESSKVKVPSVIGFLKPILLLPVGALSGIPQTQLEMIIVHELAHIKRADYLFNIFQNIIEIIFFFNPAVWWISSIIKEEREYCCDDIVSGFVENRVDYAKALNSLANISAGNSFAMAIKNKNENQFFRRIERMLTNKNTTSFWPGYITLILFTAIFSLSVIACSSTGNETVIKNDDIDLVFDGSDFDNGEINNLINYDEGERTITFNKRDDFDDEEWEVHLNDGEITRIYLNGRKLSEEEKKEKSDYIYATLKELKSDMIDLKDDMKNLKFDLANINIEEDQIEKIEDLIEELEDSDFAKNLQDLKVDLNYDDEDLHVNIDMNIGETINAAMEGLREALENIEINVNGEELEIEAIAEIEALEAMKDLDIDIDIDMDELKIGLHDLKIELENLDEGIHLKDLKKELHKLKENMHDLKIDLKHQKREMNEYKKFMHELQEELCDDGYIDNVKDDFDMYFSPDRMTVDGKNVSQKHHKKYMGIYKNYTGNDFRDDDITISINK
ncbi:MAG: hypothetical protein JEY94_08135 [Melioribacteraceae bacterium]|nr:hypothetical protein [Melioribacteraceae bacterium]